MNYLKYLHNLCVLCGMTILLQFGCRGLWNDSSNSSQEGVTSESKVENQDQSSETVAGDANIDEGENSVSSSSRAGEANNEGAIETVLLSVVDEYDRVFDGQEYVGNLLINRDDNRCDGIALISGDTLTLDELINRDDFTDIAGIINRDDLVGLSLYVEKTMYDDTMNNWELSDDVAENGSIDTMVTITIEEEIPTNTFKSIQTHVALENDYRQNNGSLYCIVRTMARDGTFSDTVMSVKAEVTSSFVRTCKIPVTIHSVYDTHVSLALFTDHDEDGSLLYNNGYVGQINFATSTGSTLPWFTITKTTIDNIILKLTHDAFFTVDAETNLNTLDSVESFEEFYDQDNDGVFDVFQASYAATINDDT